MWLISIRCCQLRSIKTSSVPKKIWLAAAIAWTVFVTVLCFVSFGDLPTVNVSGVDKYVHATFHFILVWVWYFALRPGGFSPGTLWMIVGLSGIYGVLIEFGQGALTATRQADSKDVVANLAGAVIAALVITILRRVTERL